MRDASYRPSQRTASQCLQSAFSEHRALVELSQSVVADSFAELSDVCITALRTGNKLMLFGNGGSAADAQHIATELAVRYRQNRAALAAIALSADVSSLTGIGNDFGFQYIFARQIEAIARPGDVAMGISTSGNSANVVMALERARALGCRAVGMSGNSGGAMAGVAKPLIIVPSQITARIQEIHILLGHALCDLIEERLGSPS